MINAGSKLLVLKKSTSWISQRKVFYFYCAALKGKTENACGMSSESKEDERAVEFCLPRMMLKLRNFFFT